MSGALFQYLFYGHQMGINTLLFTAFTFIASLFFIRLDRGFLFTTTAAGLLLASVAVVLGHTIYSFVVYWCASFIFLGVTTYSSLKHLQHAPILMFLAVKHIPSTLVSQTNNTKQPSRIRYDSFFRFMLLPLLVVFTLLIIYSLSNKFFAESITQLMNQVLKLFTHFSFGRIFFFLIGVIVLTYLFIDQSSSKIAEQDRNLSYTALRIRLKNKLIKGLSRLLLRKQQVALVLFMLLNLMIGWLNYLDITHIWFGFNWDGGFLKDMVHEGTYLLIAALIISIAVSLYYLNGNLVFMTNNKWFNRLIILWLIQNLIMVVSVALRNMYYIEYFALAYKRIFIFFFLLACMVGIVSIIYKIIKQRSFGYILSVNSFSVYVIILVSACFNWDGIIARYNFNHYQESFVHYEFLRDLNNAALPYLITDEKTLEAIDEIQVNRFSFSSGSEYKRYLYIPTVEKRKQWFKEEWQQRTWQDWNYPESKSYKMLNK